MFEFFRFLSSLKDLNPCLESDKTITEVSYDCGFTNLANFNRQFRRHYRMTPKEYRKHWGEEELPSFTEERT